MDAWKCLDMLDDFFELSEEEYLSKYGVNLTPNEREHGKCVDMKFSSYHDIYVYEDGYEEWVYIGD